MTTKKGDTNSYVNCASFLIAIYCFLPINRTRYPVLIALIIFSLLLLILSELLVKLNMHSDFRPNTFWHTSKDARKKATFPLRIGRLFPI